MTYPSRPGVPPLSSTQILINTEMEEFQLVDLSRRFLILDSFWSLPRQFLGNKVNRGEVWGGGVRGGWIYLQRDVEHLVYFDTQFSHFFI